MRTIAAMTICAVLALTGAASAQDSPSAAPTASGDPLAAAVAGYAAYQLDVTAMRARRLNAANDLEAVIDQGARHNRDALSRGWIAYGAYAAAQSPAFVRGVRDAASHYGRDAVIWALTANSRYADTLPGAGEANRLVLTAANADGARIIAVADRYQEMAYALQRQAWARGVAPAQAARVARIRAAAEAGSNGHVNLSEVSPRLVAQPLSLTPMTDPNVLGGRRFWDALRGDGQVTEAAAPVTVRFRVDPPRGEAVYRMTTLAALHTLGATGSERTTAINAILDEPRSNFCLAMAQRQLFQCMSAARFRYENAFCLGQHALRDVGRCISAVALSDAPATPAPASASR